MHHRLKSSQNKLFGQHNHTIEFFWLFLILSQPCRIHSWLANICCSYVLLKCSWSYCYSFPFFFSHLNSNVFLHCTINILRQENISSRIKSIIYFITQFIDQYDWLAKVMNPFSFFYTLFSGENCIWSLYLLFMTAWFSLDISGEITSGE